MRKVTTKGILMFLSLLSLILILAIGTAVLVVGAVNWGNFNGIVIVASVVLLIYFYAILLYRVFLRLSPLREGEIEAGDSQEVVYDIYVLFFLVLFYSLTRSRFIPVPIMREIYIALGAKLGENSYSAGTILDPILTEIGENSIIGHDAVLYSHAIEGCKLSHKKIKIGDRVTVGAKAIIMSGVIIESDAIVAAGAVVLKGEHIKKNEIWGGSPARLIKLRDDL